MTLNDTKLRLPQGRFFTDEHPKGLIVLHFTAGGSAAGAYQGWLGQKDQVATPYLLDLDGTVYETFSPKLWAYHLGVTGPIAQNHRHDKRSVPIEIVGLGPLKLKGDTLYSWPNNYNTVYCKLSDTAKYVKAPFRGFDYFTGFTAEQIVVIPQLVEKISADFKIPLTLPPVDKREAFDLNFFDKWTGVASHQNFRTDKSDIGPAFPWGILHG